MSEDGEKKAAAAAPPAGLFGDDSSSSSGEDEAPAAPAPAAPAAAAEGAEPMDTTDDQPAAAAAAGETSPKPTSNAALFGDDDSSSGEEDAPAAAPAAAAAAATAPAGEGESASKPTSNAGLFGEDDSDDDSDDDGAGVAFDDVKGRSATDAERAAMTERAADLAAKSVLPGSSEAEGEAAAQQSSARPTDNRRERPTLQKKEPRRLEVLEVPRPADIHKCSSADKMSLHVTKLPNLVGIQSQPYDPDTHDPEEEAQDYRGYTHSMIRWRYKKVGGSDGTFDRDDENGGRLIRESNARFVKWSDGTYTLHVGPDVFEVDQIGAPKPPAPGTAAATAAAKAAAARAVQGVKATKAGTHPYPGLNGYVYLTQTIRAAQSDVTGEALPDVAGRTILECQGPITSRLVPRPSSLQSAAHKNLTLAVRQRNMKKARIQEMTTTEDPELEKARKIKANEDLAKQERRKGGGAGGRRSGGGRVGMNRRYLEEDDDDRYDTVNVSRMKRRSLDQDGEAMDYGDSSGAEEDEWSRRKTRGAARQGGKKPAAVESSEEEEFDFGDDDDDEEEAVIMSKKSKAAAGKKRTHQAIEDDDDDDD